MALSRQLWALLHALSLAALARAQTGSITLVESDNAFEHEVMEGESCWAVLFVSNVPTEPTEHWQMRFELASASLADRVRLGIVAVHDAPNATAEFLTTTTPQIVLFKHGERFGERLLFTSSMIGVAELSQRILEGIKDNPSAPEGDRAYACQKIALTPLDDGKAEL